MQYATFSRNFRPSIIINYLLIKIGKRRKEKKGDGGRRKEKVGDGRRRKEKEGEARRVRDTNVDPPPTITNPLPPKSQCTLLTFLEY